MRVVLSQPSYYLDTPSRPPRQWPPEGQRSVTLRKTRIRVFVVITTSFASNAAQVARSTIYFDCQVFRVKDCILLQKESENLARAALKQRF